MDFGQLVAQLGLPGAAAVFLAWQFYRDRERERTEWRKDRDELKAELKTERLEKDKINTQVRSAVDTLDRFSSLLPKQIEQGNDLMRTVSENQRILTELRDRVNRLEVPR